jgi:PAS domain S-box-containing protein
METRGSAEKQTSQINNGSGGDSRPVVDPVGVEELSREHFSYLRLLFFLVISVFLAEVAAMIVVYELPPLPYEYVTLIDAGIMTILIFPMLYFLSFQPLIRHLNKRRQAEKAVEAERQRFNNILEALPAYVVLLTPDYHVPFANRVFRERFGESEDKRCYEHLFGRSEPCEVCETFRVLDIMSPTRWEWTGPDHHIYDVFDYPFTDADGSTMILEMGIDITEQKRAEDANRQLSRIVEQTEDTVVVTDREGVIEYVNPAFERLTGYTKEELLGKTPRVIKSDLHDGEFYQVMWDTILKGDVFQGEIANRKKNGELFYEVKTITPLRDAHGNITHFVATGKDITQRKLDEEKLLQAYDELELRVQERTEELKLANTELEDEIRIRRQVETELRQSEQRLKRAQEIAHLGSWELDLVANQLTWSDEVYRLFGLQPQEFGATYEAFLEAVHPEDRAAVDAAYLGSIRDGRDQYEIEHRVVRQSSGEVRIVHERCEHFRNEAGQIICSTGMVHDITERKLAEEALRQSEEKFRSAFANAAIGFAMTTPDGTFVDANPAYCALTGYSIEELQTLRFPHLIYSDDFAENMKLIDQMLSDQISDFMVENRYRRKSGEAVWVRKSISLVRTVEGTPQWIIALVEDITKRKQAEEALRRAHNELEVRVEERTKELAAANRDLVKEIAERKEVERQLRIQTTAMESAANGIIITDRQGHIQWANPALTHMSGYDTHELIGQSMRIFRSGQNNGDYYSRMWNTILSGEVWREETINRRKDGSLYIEEQTITPVRDEDGQIPHFIAIKQDITRRKQDEKELERRNAELQIISDAEHNQRQFSEALVGAALVLNNSLKLNDVLSLILDQIRGVIPYQLANISLLEGDSFYDACHHGDLPWPSALTGMNNRFLVDSFPLLAEMRQSGKPILVLDSQKHPAWIDIEGMSWIRSLLSAPLLAEQKVMGFVTLFSDQPGFFTAQMSSHLVAFAAHAAVAIQNAWLFEQVQASTERLQSLSRRLVEIQENERRYISRELHDEAGQVLTSLLVDLRLLEKNISEPKILQKIVTGMEGSLNGVIENLHRIAMALRPASLDHVGLVAALRQHTESMAEKHGLNISFTSGGAVERLPANVETVLYRIVQESLTNIVRHAHATRVDVVLTVRDGKLIVIIEDDGIGFDPEAAPAGSHLGLFGMRERAEMIDAKLMIESSPGNGTTIMMEVGYAGTIVGRR